MNYYKIHEDLIKYIRETKHTDRIKKRNIKDIRLLNKFIYIEVHHIIPRSLGGLDVFNNLIEVLPEEHIFLHMLRYKIYKKREDILSVRFMLNGYTNNNNRETIKIALNKKIRMGYSWIRSNAAELRKNLGWHTLDGLDRIRKSRIGTMPAKDARTNKMIGSVKINHPKVLSGEWVHHSKGIKHTKERRQKISQMLRGQKNPNASGLSEDYFVTKGIEAFHEFGFVLSWGNMLKLSKLKGFKWIKSLKSRFNGRGLSGYYNTIEKLIGQRINSSKRINILNYVKN